MFAQDKPQLTEAQRSEQKAKREELMKTRLELLKTELELTDAQFVKFDPIYRKYRAEIQRVTSVNRDAKMKKDEITNENALKVVSARLSNQILTATVKQNYLLTFAEILEPLKIMKLYSVDEKVSREAMKIMKYRNASAPLQMK